MHGKDPDMLAHMPALAAPDAADTHAQQTLEKLAKQIRSLETACRPASETIPSGCKSMDKHLPGGGFARGSMLELIRSGTGSQHLLAQGGGISTIAWMIAKQASQEGKYLVVVDARRQLYPPALQALGVPLDRVIALHPSNHADLVWGVDQALRCSAVGAVIAEIHSLEDRIARRWQLATEQGGGLGILVREAYSARTQPSWSDVQWQVAPRRFSQSSSIGADARWFDMKLTRCHGGRVGEHICVGVDRSGHWHEASTKIEARHEHASAVHLAAQLAQPTRRRRELAG
jgi:protein ImuA